MAIQLYAEDMDALARGATFVSSGGGGPTRLAALLAKRTIADNGPVELLDAVRFEGAVAVVGLTGAPQIDDEKLPSGDDLEHAVQQLSHFTGPADAIGGLEIGGSNAFFPVVAAARLGLPLVDFDTMGRSFPGTTMSTLFVDGSMSNTFVVFADALGRFSMIPASDRNYVERMAAVMNQAFGGVSACAIGPIDSSKYRHVFITGSYRRALRIGRVLLESGSPEEIFDELKPADSRLFFVGKIVRMMDNDADHRDRGVCIVETRIPNHLYLRLDYQNEFLMLSADGEVIAATPETITVIDARTLRSITPADLAYGREVAIYTIPAPLFWQQPEHASFVGLRAFGYGQ